MPEITVRQLEYFLAVVDHGSISAAARQLHISQAAISVAIRQLEKGLNAELLNRAPARRALPTPAGQALLPHARRVTTAISDATEAVSNDHSEIRGVLRVVSSMTVSPHVLPRLVAHFTAEHPAVEVTIAEATVPEIHQVLRSGQADLGFVYARQSAEDLDETLIGTNQHHVMVHAEHPLAGRPGILLRELIHEPMIMVDIPPSVERVTQIITDLGLRPRVQWSSSNFETVRSLVGHGLGWAFVNVTPRTEVTYDGRKVAYVPILDDIPANPIIALTAPSEELPARVREALRHLQDQKV
ncbi:LysR substrate-binding domain-containing protein [Nesterenkonia xinjiangensis]|uniref:DNA-binding transcriptional LysR family regulator n=1 Tax=Nesterenkonia xinjiangensis TaxID=225327 RepID=A0A7Z0GKY4_9MICC|nr:DNA-binding transcriptional LysR family regulator [Nesterenkonia xinjiangensis]